MASGICFPIALNLARHAFLIGPMDSDGPCWTTCNRTFSTKSSIINFSARSISPVKTQARSCQSTCGESLPCAIFFTLLVIAHNLKNRIIWRSPKIKNRIPRITKERSIKLYFLLNTYKATKFVTFRQCSRRRNRTAADNRSGLLHGRQRERQCLFHALVVLVGDGNELTGIDGPVGVLDDVGGLN